MSLRLSIFEPLNILFVQSFKSEMATHEAIELTIVENDANPPKSTKRKFYDKHLKTFKRTKSVASSDSPKKIRKGGSQSPGTYKGEQRTYAQLIIYALESGPECGMQLSEIYNWMKK